jgi:hypothetical protein
MKIKDSSKNHFSDYSVVFVNKKTGEEYTTNISDVVITEKKCSCCDKISFSASILIFDNTLNDYIYLPGDPESYDDIEYTIIKNPK